MLSLLKYGAAAVAVFLLVACSQTGTSQTVTIQDLQNQIKAACNFVPTVQSIVAVATTITSAIDPAAGATATILASTGNVIVTDICKAVQTEMVANAKKGAPKAGEPASLPITIKVNGVDVTGTYTPSATST
jgi:hypothetical protein